METNINMIYRKLDSNGDYTFGLGSGNFYTNSPEAVGQAVKTRLSLIAGEWFLDTSAGTPYNSQILGAGTLNEYVPAIQEVIVQTKGVKEILNFTSYVDPTTRKAVIDCLIDTIYGQTSILTTL